MHIILKKHRNHPFVGRIFYSEYFGKHIVTTAYKTDSKWYFKFTDNLRGDEFKAESRYSYFVTQDIKNRKVPEYITL